MEKTAMQTFLDRLYQGREILERNIQQEESVRKANQNKAYTHALVRYYANLNQLNAFIEICEKLKKEDEKELLSNAFRCGALFNQGNPVKSAVSLIEDSQEWYNSLYKEKNENNERI